MQGELFSNNLNYFMVLYETLDYSIAARKVPMSYQGLRKAILRLEQGLGTVLFSHDENGRLRPTEQADALYDQVQRWGAEASQLQDQLMVISEKSRKAIYVGFGNGTLPFMGGNLVTELEQEYPDLTLRAVEGHGSDIDQALHDGEFPFVMNTSPFDDEFELVEAIERQPHVWLAPDHPKAHRSSLALSDFSHETILTLGQEEKFAKLLMESIDAAATQVSYRHLSNPFWLLAGVMQGDGISVAIDWMTAAIKGHVDIVAIPIESNLHWYAGLTKRKDSTLTRDEQRVLDFLQKRLRAHRSASI